MRSQNIGEEARMVGIEVLNEHKGEPAARRRVLQELCKGL
jgi:hypothetical protein